MATRASPGAAAPSHLAELTAQAGQRLAAEWHKLELVQREVAEAEAKVVALRAEARCLKREMEGCIEKAEARYEAAISQEMAAVEALREANVAKAALAEEQAAAVKRKCRRREQFLRAKKAAREAKKKAAGVGAGAGASCN